jgi:uncharacterized membrane protein
VIAPAGARWQRLAVALAAALVLLDVLWELWLAPLQPTGSWLALKALPLALIWPYLARGAIKARQAAALLLPFYFAEGIVRALTESGRHALVAWMAAGLAIAAFGAVLMSFRRIE